MNKTILFTAIFLLSGLVFINTATADDKPGTTNKPGKVSVVVYPNPVVDVVTIFFERPVDEPIVETFNVNGQRMPAHSTGGDGDGGSNKTEVDLSTLAPGIYFLKVYSKQEVVHTQQIIKY